MSGETFIDPRAAEHLNALAYPRYYLDFETVQFAVPRWAGTRPYEQLPFQWSCHVEREDGSLEHLAFLDTTGAAPMEACLRALIEAVGDDGPIFEYSGYEGRILREGVARHPDLARALDAIRLRLVDLCGMARAHYYHPAQKGSWSLKDVLPTVAPELDHAKLDQVGDGGAAQSAYREIIDPATTVERRGMLADALRTYCARDTQGMVTIVRHLAAGDGG